MTTQVADDTVRLELVAYGRHQACECVATKFADHLVIAWFFAIDGRPRIVGLEFDQVPGRDREADRERLVDRLSVECKKRAKRYQAQPPTALDRMMIAGIPFSALVGARNHLIELRDDLGEAEFVAGSRLSSGEFVGLTGEEVKLVRYLADAIAYTDALQRGDRNPAQAVADLDGPTGNIRTAQGRIRKARSEAIGLLTPARQGRSGGELTPKAVALRDKLEKLHRTGTSKAADHG